MKDNRKVTADCEMQTAVQTAQLPHKLSAVELDTKADDGLPAFTIPHRGSHIVGVIIS